MAVQENPLAGVDNLRTKVGLALTWYFYVKYQLANFGLSIVVAVGGWIFVSALSAVTALILTMAVAHWGIPRHVRLNKVGPVLARNVAYGVGLQGAILCSWPLAVVVCVHVLGAIAGGVASLIGMVVVLFLIVAATGALVEGFFTWVGASIGLTAELQREGYGAGRAHKLLAPVFATASAWSYSVLSLLVLGPGKLPASVDFWMRWGGPVVVTLLSVYSFQYLLRRPR